MSEGDESTWPHFLCFFTVTPNTAIPLLTKHISSFRTVNHWTKQQESVKLPETLPCGIVSARKLACSMMVSRLGIMITSLDILICTR